MAAGLEVHWGWRAARVSAFALVSVSIGALGHALTSGTAVNLPVLVVGLSVALLWGWLLTYGRQPASLLVATVAIVQVGIHVASKVHAPPPVTGEHAAQAVLGGSPLGMVAVHLVASLLGVALLLHLERRAWRAVRRVGLVVLKLLRRPRRRPRPSADRHSIPSSGPRLAHPRWWSVAWGCRGPPEACVGFR